MAKWVKSPPAMQVTQADAGSILGSGRSPGGEHGNPLHYTCLENPMGRVAWWGTVHGVTGLDMTELLHMHIYRKVYAK